MFLMIAMLILQYNFQRMRNTRNCKGAQSSGQDAEKERRAVDIDLGQLDEIIAPLKSKLGDYSVSLNGANPGSKGQTGSKELRGESGQIGEYVEKIYSCLSQLQDIIKGHHPKSIRLESEVIDISEDRETHSPPSPQVLKIRPNLKVWDSIEEIDDPENNKAGAEEESGSSIINNLPNPLSFIFQKPVEKEGTAERSEVIRIGQQQLPNNSLQNGQKDEKRVILLVDDNDSSSREVEEVVVSKKKKRIRKSKRILDKKKKKVIVLDEDVQVKSEKENEPTESNQGPKDNEISREEVPQMFANDEKEPVQKPIEEETYRNPLSQAIQEQRSLPQVIQNEAIRIPNQPEEPPRKVPRRRSNENEERITNEFRAILKIVGVRFVCNDEKIYRWEVGTQRQWKTIDEALNDNFEVFIKESKRYKAKFVKYLPENIKSKKEGSQKFEQHNGESLVKDMKMEKLEEMKTRRKRREIASLREIFNKVQLEKVEEYEKYRRERNESSDEGDSKNTEFEPEDRLVDEIISDLVVRTNEKIQSKRIDAGTSKVATPQKKSEIKAINEIVVLRLSEAISNVNYVANMNKIFELNKKISSLSCLDGEGLGLRSNDIKVIDKATYEAEMKRLKLMEEAIVLPEEEAQSQDLKFEAMKRNNKKY